LRHFLKGTGNNVQIIVLITAKMLLQCRFNVRLVIQQNAFVHPVVKNILKGKNANIDGKEDDKNEGEGVHLSVGKNENGAAIISGTRRTAIAIRIASLEKTGHSVILTTLRVRLAAKKWYSGLNYHFTKAFGRVGN